MPEACPDIGSYLREVAALIDGEGRVLSLTPNVEAFTGYPPEKFEGQLLEAFQALTPNLDLGKEVEHLRQGGLSQEQDFRCIFRTRSGQDLPVAARLYPLEDQANGTARYLLSFLPETHSQANLQRMRELLEATPDLVMMETRPGQFFLNRAARERFGGTAQLEDLHNLHALLPGSTVRLFEEQLLPAAKAQGYWAGELEIESMQGGNIPISVVLLAHSPAGDQPPLISCICRDISQQKARQSELETRDRLLRGVAQATQALLGISKDFQQAVAQALTELGQAADADRVYLFENSRDQAGRLLMNQRFEWAKAGVSVQIDNPELQALPYDTLGNLADEFRQGKVLNAIVGQIEAPNLRQILQAQQIRSILLIPVFVEGHFWGFIGFDNCHSEEYWPESKQNILRSMAASIGTALSLRDTQKELIRAKEAAEASSQAKEEFLSNMSHEIRTPLHGIVSVQQLLEQTPLSEQQKEYLEALSFSANALMGTLDDVLDFAKLESGKLQFEQIPLNLEEQLRQLVTTFRYRAKEKHLELAYSLEGELPQQVLGDPHRLTQVLGNLLSNALKFTEEGFIVLKAELLQTQAASVLLRFSVRDSGIGISPEEQERIFQSFSQARKDITRRYGGTGLGLAIARRIVEGMGSTLQVASTPGKGSRFFFDLALPRPELDAAPPEAGLRQAPPLPAEEYRVLLAEDHQVNRLVVERMLGNWAGTRFRVTAAADGQQAFQALQTAYFDLVLLDCQMPELDGYQLARKVRQGHTLQPEVPLLAVTASVLLEDRQKILEAGMDDYLLKPFQLGRFYQKVAALLASQPPNGANPDEEAAQTTEGGEDWQVLRSIAGGDPQALEELVAEFRKQTRQDLQILYQAIENQDQAQLRRKLHSLESTARYFSQEATARAIRSLKSQMERSSCLPRPQDLEQTLAPLKKMAQ